MGDVATLQSLQTDGDAAAASGDYATAIGYANRAKFLLATMPSPATRNLTGGGSQSLAWGNAVAIDGVIANWRQLQQAAARATIGPIQSVPITYVRESSDAAYQ